MTIEKLILLKESEDKIEFKEAKRGISYNPGNKTKPKDRRRCILGYIVAFANEGGGKLVLGVTDKYPHKIVGSSQFKGQTGKLEQDIYNDLKIRVKTTELFEDKKRVLIIDIPPRPIGKFYTLEHVPLMRVGDSLLPMSQEKQREILFEVESDYTAEICEGVTINDLDNSAFEIMKSKYAEKQRNELFLSLPIEQILIDLKLLRDNKLTYAAIILLGKKKIIEEKIPQVKIFHEYRINEKNIKFSKKIEFNKPYYLLIDKILKTIDLRNDEIKIEKGNFHPVIKFFNINTVVREAINNAIAHRDYRNLGEIFIKQFPTKLMFVNPGGFPPQVNIDNILNVSVTRNHLLADVLSKTAAVERSGQGVDTIYFSCLSEGKGSPDYTKSDDFQVVLDLPGVIQDKAFIKFIDNIQNNNEKKIRLSVHEMILLDKIRQNVDKKQFNKKVLQNLLDIGLIEKIGRTRNLQYILSKDYFSFTKQEGIYSSVIPLTEEQINSFIISHLDKFKKAKIGDFVDLFSKFGLTREQTKNSVYKLHENGELKRVGDDFNTFYKLNN